MLSTLSTLLITMSYAGVKTITAEAGAASLGKIAMATVEALLSGILGNESHSIYKDFGKNFDFSRTGVEQNADVERCNRDAFLWSLIVFFKSAIKEENLNTYPKDQKKQLKRYLEAALRDLHKNLNKLGDKGKPDPKLNNEFMAELKYVIEAALSKEVTRYEEIKRILPQFVIKEFNFKNAHYFFSQVNIWVENGLSDGTDWFNTYFSFFCENLKLIEGDIRCKPYHLKAQKVIMQAEIAEQKKISKDSLKILNKIFPVIEEVVEVVKEILNIIKNIHKKVDGIDKEVRVLNKKIDTIMNKNQNKINNSEEQIQNIKGRASSSNLYKYFETTLEKDINTSQKQNIINKFDNKSRKEYLITIQGIPGIGKSYLAQEIAYYYLDNTPSRIFDIVWWIDSEELSRLEREPAENTNEDIKNLARRLNVNQADTDWLDILKTEISKHSFLIIFDNACDIESGELLSPKKFKEAYFPLITSENQQFLVTSRNEAWGEGLGELIPMKTWNEEDLKSYLAQCGIAVDDQNAFDIVFKELGGLALAASIAAAYIRKNDCSIRDYADLLVNWKPQFPLNQSDVNQSYRTSSIRKAFAISYNSLNIKTKAILNQISFLSPDEIPIRNIFEKIYKNDLVGSQMIKTDNGFSSQKTILMVFVN